MIFLDSNIPMYLVGNAQAHKSEAQVLLERATAGGHTLVTDVEVFQEILHRYISIDRRAAIEPAFAILKQIIDDVIPVVEADVLRAKEIALETEHCSARDAIHLAVMERRGISQIMSFDADFDRRQGITRIHAL